MSGSVFIGELGEFLFHLLVLLPYFHHHHYCYHYHWTQFTGSAQ